MTCFIFGCVLEYINTGDGIYVGYVYCSITLKERRDKARAERDQRKVMEIVNRCHLTRMAPLCRYVRSISVVSALMVLIVGMSM